MNRDTLGKLGHPGCIGTPVVNRDTRGASGLMIEMFLEPEDKVIRTMSQFTPVVPIDPRRRYVTPSPWNLERKMGKCWKKKDKRRKNGDIKA